MTIAVASVSSNGEIIIPKNIRKELLITPEDKFLMFGEKGMLSLKKIDMSKRSFSEIAEPFSRVAEIQGLKKECVEDVIHQHRKEKQKK